MSKFNASDFRSVKSATKKRKSSKKGKHTAAPKKKSHAKKRATTSHAAPKRHKARKASKKTSIQQYNAAGSNPVTRVSGTRAVVGAMPSPEAFKRAKEAAKKAALETEALMYSAGTAGAIGFAQAQGMLESLEFEQTKQLGGATAVVGALAFAASKFTKSKALEAIATGALNIAVYNAAYVMGSADTSEFGPFNKDFDAKHQPNPAHRVAGVDAQHRGVIYGAVKGTEDDDEWE